MRWPADEAVEAEKMGAAPCRASWAAGAGHGSAELLDADGSMPRLGGTWAALRLRRKAPLVQALAALRRLRKALRLPHPFESFALAQHLMFVERVEAGLSGSVGLRRLRLFEGRGERTVVAVDLVSASGADSVGDTSCARVSSLAHCWHGTVDRVLHLLLLCALF